MRQLVVILTLLVPAIAYAGRPFGGFADDGKHVFVTDGTVCAALVVAEDASVDGGLLGEHCSRDAKGLNAGKEPRPSDLLGDGRLRLRTRVSGNVLHLEGVNDRKQVVPLAIYDAGTPVEVWSTEISADGKLVAVESSSLSNMLVAFDVSAPLAKAAAPDEPILAWGGVWTQTGRGCRSAAVSLTLTAKHAFVLAIDLRCVTARAKSTVKGKWAARDDGGFTLTAGKTSVDCSLSPDYEYGTSLWCGYQPARARTSDDLSELRLHQ